jgi:hypothetical protein
MKHNLDLVINKYSIKEIEENIILFDDWDWVNYFHLKVKASYLY